MKFKTQYNYEPEKETKKEYKAIINNYEFDKEIYKIKKVGTIDAQSLIQEAKPVNYKDMLVIDSTGKITLINEAAHTGKYVDTTNLPKNYQQLKDFIKANSLKIEQLKELQKKLEEKQTTNVEKIKSINKVIKDEEKKK